MNQFDLSSYWSKGEIQFGPWFVAGKDNESWHDGLPAVATTANGTIVVNSLSVKSGAGNVDIVISRYNPNEPQTPPQAGVLKSGAPANNFDMSGVSSTPDGKSVYISQRYNIRGIDSTRVAKVGSSAGPNRDPDLVAMQVSLDGGPHYAGGTRRTAYIEVANQGDEATPATTGHLSLASDPPLNGDSDRVKLNGIPEGFSIPALPPGGFATVATEYDADMHSCKQCVLGAIVDDGNTITETDEYNNLNPFTDALAGNMAIDQDNWAAQQLTPTSIPDPGSTTSTLQVNTGLSMPNDLYAVIAIEHPRRGDLKVELIDSLGTTHLVQNFPDSDNTPLSDVLYCNFNTAGIPLSGVWQVKVTDKFGGNAGTLRWWSLTVP